jgi:hypothetical protein
MKLRRCRMHALARRSAGRRDPAPAELKGACTVQQPPGEKNARIGDLVQRPTPRTSGDLV